MRLRARRRENALRHLKKSQTHDRHTFFQSSVFEARFDHAFHILKRDAYAWGGLQKGKNKNLIARSLSPTEGKKKKANCFGEIREKTGTLPQAATARSSRLHLLGFISRYVTLSPLLHLFISSLFNLSLSSSLHLSRALSFPFPSLFISHPKTTPAPPFCCLIFFLFISHLKTTPAPPLCFLIFFFFI